MPAGFAALAWAKAPAWQLGINWPAQTLLLWDSGRVTIHRYDAAADLVARCAAIAQQKAQGSLPDRLADCGAAAAAPSGTRFLPF